jgi:hypothetical protein
MRCLKCDATSAGLSTLFEIKEVFELLYSDFGLQV